LGTTDISTITADEATGLLVFNTATVSDVTQGFYYWDGGKWVGLKTNNNIDNDWTTQGNSGTDENVNYIGTNDNQDFVFKTNNDEQMRIMANGFVGINTTSAQEFLDVNGDLDMGGGPSDWDSQGENIKFRARSETWWTAAENAVATADSHFYIGTTQNPDGAQFLIANNGHVNIGSDNEYDPLDMLHVTNDDENETTTIRIDNTRNANSINHTALELWDGSSTTSNRTGLQAFFRHNNKNHILEIGHTKDEGIVNFYSGDSTGNTSDITMTLDNKSHVGIGTTTPDDSAALDIDLNDAGFLMPRVSLTSTTDTATVSGSEATGLLVYNTATASDVTPGFYYWDSSKWVAIASAGGSNSDDWTILGNSGTDDTINYIGTNDSEDLVFSANGIERMRLSWDTGFFGINTSAAEEYLDVNGDIDFGGGATDWDSDGENLHFRARSEEWFIAAKNSSSVAGSSFYISTIQQSGDAQFIITNDGKVGIGSDDGGEPNDLLHVTKDQDTATTIRIDNTNNGTNTIHTSLELWDGSSNTGQMAFFRHNNRTDVLEIGQARSNGKVIFYAGHGGSGFSSSDVTMTLEGDTDLRVTIESVMNLKPGSAPSNPRKGDIYYDNSNNKVKVYTGAGWENLN